MGTAEGFRAVANQNERLSADVGDLVSIVA